MKVYVTQKEYAEYTKEQQEAWSAKRDSENALIAILTKSTAIGLFTKEQAETYYEQAMKAVEDVTAEQWLEAEEHDIFVAMGFSPNPYDNIMFDAGFGAVGITEEEAGKFLAEHEKEFNEADVKLENGEL